MAAERFEELRQFGEVEHEAAGRFVAGKFLGFVEQAGVLNVGIEGVMLSGAFGMALGLNVTGNLYSALGIAIAVHLGQGFLRAVAWRQIVAAAVPGARVRLRTAWAAQLAGNGVNAVVPVRGGDLLSSALVFAGTLLAMGPRHFAAVNVALVLAWMAIAWAIAREHRKRAG